VEIKEIVKEKYGQAALRVTTGGSSCCGASASPAKRSPSTATLKIPRLCRVRFAAFRRVRDEIRDYLRELTQGFRPSQIAQPQTHFWYLI